MLVRLEVLTFLAVADAGSVSAAARRLHCSQPAVSAHIHRLERGLGAALFERRDGQTSLLTDTGQTLVCYARAALQMQRLVEAHVRPARAEVPAQRSPSPDPTGTRRAQEAS